MTQWWPIGLLMLAVALIGCKGGDAPKRRGGKTEITVGQDGDKKGEKKSIPEKKTDHVVTALDFLKEFEADAKAADAKYKGKVVEVTGQFVNLVINHEFRLEGKQTAKIHVYCRVPDRGDQEIKIGRFSKGQKVKMVGEYVRFDEFLGPMLVGSATEIEPNNVVLVTAEELAKQFEADPKKSQQKYKENEFIVTGKVLAFGDHKVGSQKYARLAGTARSDVYIVIPQVWYRASLEPKIGEQVEIRLRYDPRDTENLKAAERDIIFAAGCCCCQNRR